MKIGIITFYASNNMGAMCQAYALQRAVQSLYPEARCGVVDYLAENRRVPPTLAGVFQRKCGRTLTGKLKGAIHCALLMRARWTSSGLSACQDFVDGDMCTFRDARISQDGKLDCSAASEPYDVLIAGSDQVWGCGFSMRPYLFCEAVQDFPVRKVAYAPSLGGLERFDDASRALLGRRASSFASLSCREADGAELLARLTGKPCPVVLDPTLLLEPEEWRRLARKPKNAPKGDFVFSYQVTWSKDCTRVARAAAKRLGLPLVFIRSITPYSFYSACGPREFLWYIANAKQVVTSSFHGTALSLSLGTPFLSVRTEHAQSRITNLLRAAGLEHCYVAGTDDLPPNLGCRHNGYAHLHDAIAASRQYLQRALGDTVPHRETVL